MPSRLIELVASRRGSSAFDRSTEIELLYTVVGADLMTYAVQAVLAQAPAAYFDPVRGVSLYLDDISWDPISPDKYEFRCKYVDPARQDERRQLETGEKRLQFDTTGGTAKIQWSRETVASYTWDNGDPAESFSGAIGVTQDGSVDGCEIVVPAMRFSIFYRQPKAIITHAYSALMESMTGTYNSAVFFGRAMGEVLFMGGTGAQGTNADPTLEYQFLRLPTLQNGTIGAWPGHKLAGIEKLGHDVLWVYWAPTKTTTGKFVARQPRWAYVERVYGPSNFANLGIGTN